MAVTAVEQLGLEQIKRQVMGAVADALNQPLKRNHCQPCTAADGNRGGS